MNPSTNSLSFSSSPFPTTYKLKSGHDIPLLGFGTWAEGAWEGTAGEWCKQATIAALKTGYRHIDTAWAYGVEDSVGDAIRESGVPREEIFITTKMCVGTLHLAADDGKGPFMEFVYVC
jgi:diketogulonate reductase-like aldo/keto reductase